jgi:choline dehydrogenase-like flavoprotein
VTRQASTYDCDVAIVGSGIAGALIGWRLATEGARVTMLEAGPPVDRSAGPATAFAQLASNVPDAPYPQVPWAPAPATLDPDNYLVQTGPDPFVSNYERRVGGTTWHWLGTMLRLLPNDFHLKSTYGVGADWPLTYEELAPWYETAEQTVGVAGDDAEDNGAPRGAGYPMPPFPLTYGDQRFAAAAETLGLRVTATPQARVSVRTGFNGRPQCCGNAFCIPMCPIGAKYDATVHVDLASAAGARVIPNAVVHRLAADGDGRITSVTYRQPDGADETLTARIVMVAAHAIETPKLLLLSRSDALPNGLANSSDQVGRNLMDHPTQLSYAQTIDPVGAYRAPLSTAGIEALRDGPFRSERGAFRIEIGNDGWSWPGLNPPGLAAKLIDEGVWGEELYTRVREESIRAVRLAALVEQLPDPASRVTLADDVDAIGIPRPRVNYVISDYTRRGLAAAREQLGQIFDALGVQWTTHVEQIQGAGHIMGTVRMGTAAAASVTDGYGRTWDHPNLWLAGSGLFPAVGTGNPTLTIAALALRAAPEIARDLATSAA